MRKVRALEPEGANICGGSNLFLIAIRNSKKTRKLVNKSPSPQRSYKNQRSDSEEKSERICERTLARPYTSHDWHEDKNENRWQEPQYAKQEDQADGILLRNRVIQKFEDRER